MQQSQTPSEAGTSLSHPRAAGTACTTTSTPTTPTNAKSSGPCETCVPADALSATTGAMAEEEEEEVEDDGKTVALAKGGATDLARTAGRTSLVREVGGTRLVRGVGEISLARITHKAMRASLLCHHSQGGMKTITRTRGLEASRSRAQSLASWAAHKPRHLSASSSNLPAK